MKTFIELWKAKDTWLSLPKPERENYLNRMQRTIPFFMNKGASILSWGKNTDTIDNKSDFDWFSIWQLPNENVMLEFEALLQEAGWYHYFEQINVCGEHVGPEEVIDGLMNL